MNTNMTGFTGFSSLCALVHWTKVALALEVNTFSIDTFFTKVFHGKYLKSVHRD